MYTIFHVKAILFCCPDARKWHNVRDMAFSLQQAQALIRTARDNNRMPHALLLAGAPSAGTCELALYAATLLNGCHADSLDALHHPLCRIVRPSSKSRRILIEDIRTIEPFLQLRAAEGQTKIVIILEADRINEQAANAFLKTLEEPPPQTLIILVTEQPSQLLSTILSRCIRMDLRDKDSGIRLTPVQQAFLPACARALSGMGKDISALALRSDFLQLLAERREEISKRINAAVKEEAKAISQGTDTRDWEAQQKDTTTALIETEYLAERAQMLDLLSLCIGQAILLAAHGEHVAPLCPEIEKLATRTSSPELLKRSRAIDALREDLNFNIHEALAMDNRLLQAFGAL